MPDFQLKESAYPSYLDWFRYFCASMLYMYGLSKLIHLQFNLQSELAKKPIGSLTGYQLTWFYFGYSSAYAKILGLTQIFGASLLLFRKTTLLGALSMLPVMLNVLLINMFILINDYGPYLISGIICTFLLSIVWHHRADLIALFWYQQEKTDQRSRAHRWIRLSIVVVTSAIMISGAIVQRHVQRSREHAYYGR